MSSTHGAAHHSTFMQRRISRDEWSGASFEHSHAGAVSLEAPPKAPVAAKDGSDRRVIACLALDGKGYRP